MLRIILLHLGQRGELTGVHVRCTRACTAQRWSLEGALGLIARGGLEAQFGAALRVGIAVCTKTVELVRQDQARAFCPSAVLGQALRCGHAGVVEVIVGQKRAIVAIDAFVLADEQAQASISACDRMPAWGNSGDATQAS